MWVTWSDVPGVRLGRCSAGPEVPADKEGKEGESCILVSRVGSITPGICSRSPVAVWGLATGGPHTSCIYQHCPSPSTLPVKDHGCFPEGPWGTWQGGQL